MVDLSTKYELTAPHSEVIDAATRIAPCRVLDLGCGEGRNSLYLAQRGFQVTSLDRNTNNIQRLQQIANAESLTIQSEIYDINTANLTGSFDWVISTVVFMFLERSCVPKIIQNMQQVTANQGVNLIVSAMSTEDTPCPLPFSFTFAEQELLKQYSGWNLLKYNEDFGELHRLDEHGNRIRLRFATMLAQKSA